MNGRVHDPRLGRFPSPDPIVGNPASSRSWNLYGYVGNNPLSRTDPTGHCFAAGPMCDLARGAGGGFTAQVVGFVSRWSFRVRGGRPMVSFGWSTGRVNFGVGVSFLDDPVASGPRHGESRLWWRVDWVPFEFAVSGTRRIDSTGVADVEPADGALTAGKLYTLASGSFHWPTSTHRYTVTGYICNRLKDDYCTEDYADRIFAEVNRIDVPFSTEDLGGGEKKLRPAIADFIGEQPIQHDEYIQERRSENATLPGHRYHPEDGSSAQVVNEVLFTGSGDLIYRVTGTGTGPHPAENVAVGLKVFTPGVEGIVETFNHKGRDRVRMLNALRGRP